MNFAFIERIIVNDCEKKRLIGWKFLNCFDRKTQNFRGTSSLNAHWKW